MQVVIMILLSSTKSVNVADQNLPDNPTYDADNCQNTPEKRIDIIQAEADKRMEFILKKLSSCLQASEGTGDENAKKCIFIYRELDKGSSLPHGTVSELSCTFNIRDYEKFLDSYYKHEKIKGNIQEIPIKNRGLLYTTIKVVQVDRKVLENLIYSVSFIFLGKVERFKIECEMFKNKINNAIQIIKDDLEKNMETNCDTSKTEKKIQFDNKKIEEILKRGADECFVQKVANPPAASDESTSECKKAKEKSRKPTKA